jgi:hypothetical protein
MVAASDGSNHARNEEEENATPPSGPAPSTVKPNSTAYPQTGEFVVWGVDWKLPAKMILFLLGGIIFAIGHHLFYSRLHDTPAVGGQFSQDWALRIGTGLAFLSKAALAVAVSVAYAQYFWKTAAAKGLELRTLDNMFAVCSDISAFGDLRMLQHAKMVAFTASIVWSVY